MQIPLTFIALCLLAWFCQWLSGFVPLPAALLGMLILFGFLLVMGGVPKPLQRVSAFLLKHLSLFFIPATLSIVLFAEQLAGRVWIIALALLVSTVVSLWLTALISQKVLER